MSSQRENDVQNRTIEENPCSHVTPKPGSLHEALHEVHIGSFFPDR